MNIKSYFQTISIGSKISIYVGHDHEYSPSTVRGPNASHRARNIVLRTGLSTSLPRRTVGIMSTPYCWRRWGRRFESGVERLLFLKKRVDLFCSRLQLSRHSLHEVVSSCDGPPTVGVRSGGFPQTCSAEHQSVCLRVPCIHISSGYNGQRG